MFNNIRITSTTHLLTGFRSSTCEMFLTLAVEEYFQREIFPQFKGEVQQGVQRPVGSQIQYYCFDLIGEKEKAFRKAITQAGPLLQAQLQE